MKGKSKSIFLDEIEYKIIKSLLIKKELAQINAAEKISASKNYITQILRRERLSEIKAKKFMIF